MKKVVPSIGWYSALASMAFVFYDSPALIAIFVMSFASLGKLAEIK